MLRSTSQKIKDCITFPFRAFTLFEHDRWSLSCLATERFDYVSREVTGYCLDIGCGKRNRFIKEFRSGNGIGIDVFPYEGLAPEHIVTDMTHFPFADASFDTVTFIANVNHIPRGDRDKELKEAYRCLKPGGKIIITMGNPLAELAVHQVVYWYDKLLGTHVDMDTERGMHEDEEYFLTDKEIRDRVARAGFTQCTKKYFGTQWFLNHLFVAVK